MEAPASRNAPCPCGSGRRFKDCHGVPDAAATAPHVPLARILADALAAQQAGRLAEAIDGYRQALLREPRHFDALHMLGVAHFQRGEFETAAALIDRALEIDAAVPAARFNRRLAAAALERRDVAAELRREAEAFARRPAAAVVATHTGDDRPVRVVAFYLPQYHRIAENDAWWGEGFTEWTNVRKARPNFAGHWQPHEPGELGYYDLTDERVRDAQAALARAHGVDAFCYYHYWFGGRRLLERPLDAVLASGRPDFPFCICWANENWTRRWDGGNREILMEQPYAADHARAFIASVLPLFRDRRYLRVDGRPLLIVYRIADIPDAAATVATWRAECRKAGAGDPYLCAVQWHVQDDPTQSGFDAAVEFPPLGHAAENVTAIAARDNPAFGGMVFDYANLASHYLMLPRPPFRQFRGVTPMWDNTARRQTDGMIVHGSSPALFGVWLEHVIAQTRLRRQGDERLVFVNAWNEWAEGNHLEPDARHGTGYLDAARVARQVEAHPLPSRPALAAIEAEVAALQNSGAIAVERTGTQRAREHARLSVVMPIYNHAPFLDRALDSLLAQTRLPDELVAVDDGSRDDSAGIVSRFAQRAPFPVTVVRQANAGADRALNRGIALAQGEIVALLNSDDAYLPQRLERLTAALTHGVALAFSDVELVDDDDARAEGAYADELRARIAAAASAELLRSLVFHNVATSTGNLVLRRELVTTIGGFAPYAICHDWDFVLAATYVTRPAFVHAPLYAYRLHDANTFAGRRLAGHLEGDAVLQRFFARIHEHPAFDSAARADFLAYVRANGLGGYVPEAMDP